MAIGTEDEDTACLCVRERKGNKSMKEKERERERERRKRKRKRHKIMRQETKIVFLANLGSIFFLQNKLKWRQIGDEKMHHFAFFKRVRTDGRVQRKNILLTSISSSPDFLDVEDY